MKDQAGFGLWMRTYVHYGVDKALCLDMLYGCNWKCCMANDCRVCSFRAVCPFIKNSAGKQLQLHAMFVIDQFHEISKKRFDLSVSASVHEVAERYIAA